MSRHAIALDPDEAILTFQRQRSAKIAMAITTLAVLVLGGFAVVYIAYSVSPAALDNSSEVKY